MLQQWPAAAGPCSALWWNEKRAWFPALAAPCCLHPPSPFIHQHPHSLNFTLNQTLLTQALPLSPFRCEPRYTADVCVHHTSVPCCTLPAIACTHTSVVQTHFFSLLQRLPLAFINTETFCFFSLTHLTSLSALTSPVGSHTHEQTPNAHQHLSPFLCIQRGGLCCRKQGC